ncbi:LCP family protein [Bacillota bacterium LX-D]|nr:LCP family protein [Bacillota bacterium LX-D]
MGNRTNQDYWYTDGVPKRRKKKKKKRAAFSVFLLFFLAFGACAFAGYKASELGLTDWLKSQEPSAVADENPEMKGKLNVLLLGVDQREKENARADTIMVAFLDLEKSQVSIISVPRDTYADIPGYRSQKINHSHALGGPELTAEAVSDLLGVQIDKYVEVNFENFEKIIDTMGGVTIDVEKRMVRRADGIDLQPGVQKLNGKDALAYVRYRSDGDDTTRIKRQQKFMKEVASEAMSLNTVFRLPKLVGEINDSVKTNLTTKEMLSLGNSLRKCDASTIQTSMLPGTPKYIGGISYWLPDEEEVADLVDLYSGNATATAEDTDTSLSDNIQ